MEQKINWGILGNARIGRVCVVPAIDKSRNGRIQAVGSRSVDKAKELTDKHGGVPVEGYEAVLQDSAVDAVYIPLPNQLHKKWAIKALNAGKHVLVEKPFAMNAAEAEEMVACARASGKYLMEAQMWRFHPRSIKIKEMVQSGELGKIGSIRTAFTFPVQRDAENERLFSPEMGGGSLWDVGCYGVSVARWMLNAEPESVSAVAVIGESGVDINFVGTLKFADGTLATVESGFMSHLQQTYSIAGTQGSVELPHDAFIPWETDAHFTWRKNNEETGDTVTVPGADEYQLMVEYFGDVLNRKITNPVDPADSIAQMKVLDALKVAFSAPW